MQALFEMNGAEMTRKQIIDYFGGVNKAAEALGYSRYGIWLWRKGVPTKAQSYIEAKTGGALVASKPKSKK